MKKLLKASVLFGITVVALLWGVSSASAAPVTVNCSGTSGSPTAVTEGDLNADDVTFSDSGGDGYCELDAAITAASVLIETGVVLTHVAEDADGINISTTGNFEIESGASINTDAKGCDNTGTSHGWGPDGSNVCTSQTAGYGKGWNMGNVGAEGAGHGGEGGAGSNMDQFGDTYGSATAPVLFGSSGGSAASTNGGSGGGYVRLNISGAFTHNGVISADGGAGITGGSNTSSGGGSGGSIYITVTGAFAGSTGTFSADGGNGADGGVHDGGGGGGGRISLTYGSSTFVGLGSEDLTVAAGTADGSAVAGTVGTVYVKDTGVDAVNVYHGFTFDDTDHSVTNWTVDTGADNMYCESGTATPSVTASGTLAWDGTLSCDLTTITSFNFSGGTAFTIASGTVISIAGDSADVDFDIPAGDDQTWTDFTFTEGAEGLFTIDDAIDIDLAGTTTITANAQWTALVDLTIGASASIVADAKGCVNIGTHNGYGPDGSNVCTISTAGWGDGNNSGNGYQGGGHGGAGGDGSHTSVVDGGATYGSATAPVLFGSSGGNSTTSFRGGNGGGYVRLAISGDFTHNGVITADGGVGATNGSSQAGGGGSGGSVYITVTGAFAGSTGTFSADGGDGGDGSSNDGGGGGGGRISLNYGSSTFSGLGSEDFTVAAGAADGSAVAGVIGTVYVKNTGSSAVNIYYGFTFDDTDHSETNWTIDAGADNMYCESGTVTPSVTVTGTLAWDGTLSCDLTTITSFNLSAGTALTVGSGTTFSVAGQGADVDFNIPAGDDQTWTNFTFTGGPEGWFTIDDAIDITLAGTTAIIANAQWTALVDLAIESGASIDATGKGCVNVGSHNGYGPDSSNVCAMDTAGWGDGNNSGQGYQGGGHGGEGGDGSHTGVVSGGATYGSSTAPVLFGSSGGNSTTSFRGGNGGGYLRLVINGVLTHNGAIIADGGVGATNGSNQAGGGGSGGSIYVTAGSVIEDGGATGTFSADGGAGGNGSTNDGGGGGGGRIAIQYGADTDSLVTNLTAGGVAAGGAADGSAVAGSAGTLSKTLYPFLTSVTINDNNASGFTNDTTPQITLVTSGSTATDVAFSCDAGSNWSSWITYPDDDVVNDGDGPAWDMTTGATGCTTTEELKTITAKIKDGSAVESSTTNDTTTYDVSAPSVSDVTATNANDTYGVAIELTVTVQFDENMAVTGTPQIELDFDGTDRQANYASVSTDTLSFTYTTVNGDNVSDLAYTSTGALTLNSGTITDLAGNTATLTLATPGETNSLSANKAIIVSTNQVPTITTVTGAQSTDGTGGVTVSMAVDDADGDNTLQAVVEYYAGGSWTKATMSETSGTSATYGNFNVENDNVYQLGNSNGYITTSVTPNTVTATWASATDEATADLSTAQFRVFIYDGTGTGTTGTGTTFTLDNVAPSGGLTTLSSAGMTYDSFTLGWDAITTETNWNKYQVYYKVSSDASYALYGEDTTMTTTSMAITGLSEGIAYDFYVKAVDDFGNSLTSSTSTFTTEDTDDPYFGAVTGGGGGGGGGGGDSSTSTSTSDTSTSDSTSDTSTSDTSTTESSSDTSLAGEEESGEESHEAAEEADDSEEESVWLPTGVEVEVPEEVYEEVAEEEPVYYEPTVVTYEEPALEVIEEVPAEEETPEEVEEIQVPVQAIEVIDLAEGLATLTLTEEGREDITIEIEIDLEQEIELEKQSAATLFEPRDMEEQKEIVEEFAKAAEEIAEMSTEPTVDVVEVLEQAFADEDGDGMFDILELDTDMDAETAKETDTDGDGVDDYTEYMNGTDPTDSDSDGDGMTDAMEQLLGTDASSSDTDGDGIADVDELAAGTSPTEKDNPIVIEKKGDEYKDSDGDGMSDAMETRNGTDPNSTDSDGDGLSDIEELEYGTNPNQVDYIEEMKTGVTNMKADETYTSDVFVKATAQPNSTALITVVDAEGNPVAVIETTADANGKVAANIDEELLESGEYQMMIVVADEDGNATDVSTMTSFTVDKTIEAATVEEVEVEEDAVAGKTEPGSIVYVTWQSMTLSSVLVSDMETGEFVVEAPEELYDEPGEHTAYFYPEDEEGVKGETMQVNFMVSAEGLTSAMEADGTHPAAEEEDKFPYLPLIGVSLLVIAGAFILYKKARKQHEVEKGMIDKL